MANVKMGFEGLLYYGTAGTTAATQITNAKDITETRDFEKGNTTVRGDGTTIPIETEDVTVRKYQCQWTMIHDITDTVLSALLTAANAGTGIALRGKDYASGSGFDGDVTLTVETSRPLNGEMSHQFTATPTRSYGRAPVLYT